MYKFDAGSGLESVLSAESMIAHQLDLNRLS